MHDQLALAAVAAMFPEVNALPSAKAELALHDGNGKRRGGERGLDVRRHVVRSFGVVLIERIALWHESIQPALEVVLRGGIGVLLDDEARGGVADEERAQAVADTRLAHERSHLLRDLVQALAGRAHAELLKHR